jgi:hypothetical protein
MSPGTALGDPLAKRLLGNALDRLDRSCPEDRTNAVRIPIEQNTAPEIFEAETSADREIAWHVLDVLADAGIGTLAFRRPALYRKCVSQILGRTHKISFFEQMGSFSGFTSL